MKISSKMNCEHGKTILSNISLMEYFFGGMCQTYFMLLIIYYICVRNVVSSKVDNPIVITPTYLPGTSSRFGVVHAPRVQCVTV